MPVLFKKATILLCTKSWQTRFTSLNRYFITSGSRVFNALWFCLKIKMFPNPWKVSGLKVFWHILSHPSSHTQSSNGSTWILRLLWQLDFKSLSLAYSHMSHARLFYFNPRTHVWHNKKESILFLYLNIFHFEILPENIIFLPLHRKKPPEPTNTRSLS